MIYKVESVTDDEKIYTVDMSDGGTCDCGAARTKSICKHIHSVSHHSNVSGMVTSPQNDAKVW